MKNIVFGMMLLFVAFSSQAQEKKNKANQKYFMQKIILI
jgi:hypothetical protein